MMQKMKINNMIEIIANFLEKMQKEDEDYLDIVSKEQLIADFLHWLVINKYLR